MGKLIHETLGEHIERGGWPHFDELDHDIDNLFIADGSLHVTNGGFNSVLTIMALGYWVAAHIVREWKGNRFP